jgi:hypothetical protein
MNLLTLFTALVLLFSVNLEVCSQQVTSQLWGRKGEKWNKDRIPDFTKAGYREGNVKIPDYKKGVNVVDFGAKGDGVNDDTKAFKRAIAACKPGYAVFIPKGTYRLTDTLQIQKSRISLKGADRKKTILHFDKGLEELYPNYNLQSRNQTKWSWSGAMILFAGNISDSGIENLTVKFPDNKWDGHNFHERCYNGIGYTDGAHNGWVRNITFIGTDMGIWIGRPSHHITAENWTLEFEAKRLAEKFNGHHGVNIYGGYNLLQDFEIKGIYYHDLSVESEHSVYNVFRKGRGVDMCIDHHNHDQRNNLFTNLNMGKGTRLLKSGGNDTPRGISFNETYWNITADNYMYYPNQFETAAKQSKNNIAVGIKTDKPSVFDDKNGNWYETLDPAKLAIKDLYVEQVRLIKKKRVR